MDKSTRNLKVGYATTTTGRTGNRKTLYKPKILLQGNWLAKAGFLIGESTRIIVADTYIKIVKEAALC